MKNRSHPFSWFFFHIALLVCFALMSAPVAWACSGTSQPPSCPRTIFLTKFAPCTVLLPAAGAFTVPVGALPFVSWSKTGGCPKPTAATLTFNLSCVPAAGGVAIPLGPFDVPVKKPAKPGPQPLPGPVDLQLTAAQAAQLQAVGGPFVCTVTGTYTVRFPPAAQGANGGGDISGTGDVEVCLVPPPTGGDQSVPRLNMCVLPVDKKGDEFFPTCRRGDQGIVYYLITNNDPTNKATLTVTSDGKQTAGLPDGITTPTAAYAASFFAIAHPGTDVYAAAFADLLQPGSLMAEGDPTASSGQISRQLTLDPLKSSIIGVASRSYGHCLDGSCNERNLKATGTFADMTTAIACASSGALVGSVHPKSPLCEFDVNIDTSTKRDADWFTINFETTGGGNIPHGSVFVVGNQPPGQTAFTALDAPAFPHTFPSKADDYYRTEQPVTGMNYMVKSFTPFDDTTDRVEITGLNSPNAPTKFTLPAILVNPQVHGGDLDVAVNLDAETIKVTVHGTANVLTSPPDEPMKDFFRKPPTTLSVEKGTALKLTEVCKNTLPVMSVDPLGATANITADGTFAPFAVALHPDLSNGTAKWHAALLPAVGTKLEKGSDILANPIKVDLLLKHTMPFPADNVSILNVRVAGAINSPFRVPIDVRVIPGP